MRVEDIPSGSARTALLEARDVSVWFPVRGRRRAFVHAVDRVDLDVGPGETVALVGESGSGKSTLGYSLLGEYPLRTGRVRFDGRDVGAAGRAERKRLRRDMQMIFQDPYSALNPRMRVSDIVAEPLEVHGLVRGRAETAARVGELLEACGLTPEAARKFPHAFSGGQRQRIVIARALAARPRLIVADEPTSALDVSVQAQIVNLMQDLQVELGLSYLFISHDLSVVHQVAHHVVVLYAGQVVERAPVDVLFGDPLHPYSRALLSAVPVVDPGRSWQAERLRLPGEPPSPVDRPPGCRFASRCPQAVDRCRTDPPALEEKRPGHVVACWEVPVAVASPSVPSSPSQEGLAP